MAIIWKKVENDTPIRYNPEYGGEVSVEGGEFTSLVAYNTDPSSDSRVFNYIEKRIDYYHAKDDDKLTGKVYKVEIEPTNDYIEGKKLEYTRIHCGRNNSGFCTVWDYTVKWESDNSGNIRWWWWNDDTNEKEEEIDVYVTLYEDVLDACVDYFEIPSGDAIEETEDHKFATEWSTAVVGGKVTKYSSTYAEDKKMTVTAKGTLEEDEDILYITYEGEAAEPTVGRAAFNDFCNIEVGAQISNIFGVNGNKYSPYLQAKFEKFTDNVYTAKANASATLMSTTVYNLVAVYNPNYDMFSYYLGKESDSASAASNLESTWISTLASYSIYPLAGDTSESMAYTFADIGMNNSFILPSVATMEALAAEGKGVNIGALDPDNITFCQPAANKVGHPAKVDAPATAGGDAGDPETYTFSIIDDYYAYLSDAEISDDDAPTMEETINHKYAVEWDSVTVGGKATPYDPTGYTENKTAVIAAKGTLVEDNDLKYISFAGDGGPGKEAFDAIVNLPVGSRIEGVYNNNNYTPGATSGELKTTFEEKVPGELYYALFETESAGDTWMMALYNPDYDTYGLYQANKNYAGDAPSDYPSWKSRLTGTQGKFTQQLESDSTTSEVWYSPDRQELIVIPTQSVQDTYCSTSTGGVDIYGSTISYVWQYAVLSTNKNLTNAPSKFVPEPGDTYAYNIIDDYYAYLSDAELLEEDDGPDWSAVTATTEDVLPGLKFYDNTGTLVEGDMPLVVTTASDKNVKSGLTYYTWDGTTLVMHTGSGDFTLPSSLNGSPFEPDNVAFYTGSDIANRTPITYPVSMLEGGWIFAMTITIDNKDSSVWGGEYIPTGETALLDNPECKMASLGTGGGQGRLEWDVLKLVPNDGHRPLQMIPAVPSDPADRGICLIDVSYNLVDMFPDLEPEVIRDALHSSITYGKFTHKTDSSLPALNQRGSSWMTESNTDYLFFYMMASTVASLDETNLGITAYKGKTSIWSVTDGDKENGVVQTAVNSRKYYINKDIPGGGSLVMALCYLEAGSFTPSNDLVVMGEFNVPSGCTDWYYCVVTVPISKS